MRVHLVTRYSAVPASTAAINQFKGLIVSAPDDPRKSSDLPKSPAARSSGTARRRTSSTA